MIFCRNNKRITDWVIFFLVNKTYKTYISTFGFFFFSIVNTIHSILPDLRRISVVSVYGIRFKSHLFRFENENAISGQRNVQISEHFHCVRRQYL